MQKSKTSSVMMFETQHCRMPTLQKISSSQAHKLGFIDREKLSNEAQCDHRTIRQITLFKRSEWNPDIEFGPVGSLSHD